MAEALTGALAAVVWIGAVLYLARTRPTTSRIPLREQERWASEQLYGVRQNRRRRQA